ncbi:hypothetical protein NQZ68_003332 [Dissostichus eleginoides]|nr:hypothetical protein NQZ68_003332 [Dissostichus eleginoides]
MRHCAAATTGPPSPPTRHNKEQLNAAALPAEEPTASHTSTNRQICLKPKGRSNKSQPTESNPLRSPSDDSNQKQRAGQGPAVEQLWGPSWPRPGPAHPSPARPGFSVGRTAVSLVRQPGALGRWQGVRASGRGPLKSHLRGATPTQPLRWRLAPPRSNELPPKPQQQLLSGSGGTD